MACSDHRWFVYGRISSARPRALGCPARNPELGSTAAHRDVAAKVTVVQFDTSGPQQLRRRVCRTRSRVPPVPAIAISSCRDPPPSPPLTPTPPQWSRLDRARRPASAEVP
jgi:hypothetical protein